MHAIDIAQDLMKRISGSEPVMFQRNSLLYIASETGFAAVGCGLRLHPIEIREWEKDKAQPPEIQESTDVIESRNFDGRDRTVKFREGEEQYFRHIVFNDNDQVVTLKGVTTTAQELAKLPDDGKVRMVGHGSCYHSHKYGYAADGMDVWVDAARVIDRERYIELMRAEEDELIKDIRALGGLPKHAVNEMYQKLRWPDCVVMTDNMIISIPRKSYMPNQAMPISWTPDTKLEDTVLRLSTPDTYRESPFTAQVHLNAHTVTGQKPQEFREAARLFDISARDYAAVKSIMETAEQYIAHLNDLHNQVCAESIAMFKK